MRRARESGPLTRRRVLIASAVFAALAMGSSIMLMAQEQVDFQESPFLRVDPQNIVLSDRDSRVPCGECHSSEYDVWKETDHAKQFDELHRSSSARDILKQMDLTVTKRQESLCLRCHYTVGPELDAIAGVSCESCHGPAQDWMPLHNDLETPADNAELSEAAGMLRPSGNLYAVAANCFECHTVPMEKLVNVGGHSTGSSSFELVERAGDIQHNFLHEQRGESGGNRDPSPERKRVMFAVGRMLAYEYAIRGVAAATSEDRYFKGMERRVKSAFEELQDVASVTDDPAAKEILGIGSDLRLVPNNEEALLAAADRMREVGQAFGRTADGAALEGLDVLIAGGRPPVASAGGAAPVAAAPTATAPARAAPGTSPAAGQPAPAAAAEATPAAEEPAAPAFPELPGSIRQRPTWFPSPSGNQFVGAGECGSCHGEAEEWWYGDPHAESGRRLLGEDPKAWRIASLYFGGSPERMAQGGQICMSCHATVDPGSGRIHEEGVSCESCHGAASAYLEPHEDGNNPQLGMTALKVAQDRAATCARCHHMSDERLLAAGHPSGSGYDIVSSNASIQHFPERRPQRERQKRGESYPAVADGALRTAWSAVTGGRAIPQVQVASLPTPPTPAASGGAAAVPRPARGTVIPPGSVRASSLPPRPPATPRPRATESFRLELEPLPASTDSLTTEELLLLVKERLQLLYTALGRGN